MQLHSPQHSAPLETSFVKKKMNGLLISPVTDELIALLSKCKHFQPPIRKKKEMQASPDQRRYIHARIDSTQPSHMKHCNDKHKQYDLSSIQILKELWKAQWSKQSSLWLPSWWV
jgi:hypothetical protein